MYVINYSVNRMVTDFNEEYQDWSGPTTDYGDIETGVFRLSESEWTADVLLEKIKEIVSHLVWDNKEYVSVWDNGERFSFCVVEDADGTPSDDGKWLADYNVYVEVSSTHGAIVPLEFVDGNGVSLHW